MKHRVASLLLSCVILGSYVNGQSRWQRIISGDGFVIDIDVTSLTFEPDHVLSAKYRTILSKPEPLPDDPKNKYKTRVETIQFGSGYRVVEYELFDSSNKSVQKAERDPNVPWRKSTGPTASRLYSVIDQLPPFGTWKITAFRYTSGEKPSGGEPIELSQIVGHPMIMTLYNMSVGKQTCSSPVYESETISAKSLSEKMGGAPEALGPVGDPVQTIKVSCNSGDWKPPRSLLIRLNENQMFLLWEGVLLELTSSRQKEFRIPFSIH